ncbi:unnamed protein product [Schistocephalus solidus]|uniref:Tubulin domain-containing protein n=1 Tax=Schistocephalus solidus TaxID=70667 RepID=A0A183T7D5_SCHSO|nr:unnamed protein product [Schistocephalus solidus]
MKHPLRWICAKCGGTPRGGSGRASHLRPLPSPHKRFARQSSSEICDTENQTRGGFSQLGGPEVGAVKFNRAVIDRMNSASPALKKGDHPAAVDICQICETEGCAYCDVEYDEFHDEEKNDDSRFRLHHRRSHGHLTRKSSSRNYHRPSRTPSSNSAVYPRSLKCMNFPLSFLQRFPDLDSGGGAGGGSGGRLGEVISLFVGQCGTQISQALWELISVEHGIGPDGTLVDPGAQTEDDTAGAEVLFTHTQKDRFVPRAAIVDSEPTVVDEIRNGLYRGMFNPARLVTGLEDMANNFGRGYYGCPQNLVDQGMNAVRKEAEQADKLQSCLIFHAFGGGTGSGTTCRLVELLDAEFMKVPKIEMAIYPDYHKSCSVVEPYNAVLCSSTLDEISSFAIMIENDALTKICNESLRMERPAYPNLNRVLAHIVDSLSLMNAVFYVKACSGILAPLTFDGPLTASLPQLQTNLVPYPRLHFLQASLNPMFTHDITIHESITIQELTIGAFNTINQMMVGDPKETVMMAAALLYRGQIPIQEINSSIDTIKKRGLIGLVDWCPTGFKIGVVPTLPAVIKASGIGKTNRQLTALYNSTLIVSPLRSNLHKFRVLLSKKAFVHWYLQEGMEQGEFQECMEDVLNILQDYLFVESKRSSFRKCNSIKALAEIGVNPQTN